MRIRTRFADLTAFEISNEREAKKTATEKEQRVKAAIAENQLSHILQLQPDLIKLDMGITRHIDLDMARRVLASELRTLQNIGVEKAQGCFLGRPMSRDDAVALLDRNAPASDQTNKRNPANAKEPGQPAGPLSDIRQKSALALLPALLLLIALLVALLLLLARLLLLAGLLLLLILLVLALAALTTLLSLILLIAHWNLLLLGLAKINARLRCEVPAEEHFARG